MIARKCFCIWYILLTVIRHTRKEICAAGLCSGCGNQTCIANLWNISRAVSAQFCEKLFSVISKLNFFILLQLYVELSENMFYHINKSFFRCLSHASISEMVVRIIYSKLKDKSLCRKVCLLLIVKKASFIFWFNDIGTLNTYLFIYLNEQSGDELRVKRLVIILMTIITCLQCVIRNFYRILCETRTYG